MENQEKELIDPNDPNIFMEMWVIYDHPLDYPDCFIARRWIVTRHSVTPEATEEIFTSTNLNELRLKLPSGFIRTERAIADDPKIIETWI